MFAYARIPWQCTCIPNMPAVADYACEEIDVNVALYTVNSSVISSSWAKYQRLWWVSASTADSRMTRRYKRFEVPSFLIDLFESDRFLSMPYARHRQAVFSQSLFDKRSFGLTKVLITLERRRCFRYLDEVTLDEWFQECAKMEQNGANASFPLTDTSKRGSNEENHNNCSEFWRVLTLSPK